LCRAGQAEAMVWSLNQDMLLLLVCLLWPNYRQPVPVPGSALILWREGCIHFLHVYVKYVCIVLSTLLLFAKVTGLLTPDLKLMKKVSTTKEIMTKKTLP
jgi:hypothetical protein